MNFWIRGTILKIKKSIKEPMRSAMSNSSKKEETIEEIETFLECVN